MKSLGMKCRWKDPVWNLWKHGVTSSFLNTYVTCREQAKLAYVDGLTAMRNPLAIDFGTCVHWVLQQAYEKPTELPDLKQCRRWLDEFDKLYRKQTPMLSTKGEEQHETVLGLAETVLPNYFLRWQGDFTGNYKFKSTTTRPVRWVSLEQIFRVPYQFEDGMQTWINGRRDGVFRDKRGKLWVFDTKCKSVIVDDDIMDTLEVDLQQMLYLYVTMVQEEEAPAGVILNVVRRPTHRRLQDEAFKTFLGRVLKDVSNVKRYDHFFIRYEMATARSEILEWKKNLLDPLMKEVRMWWEGSLPHWMNPNSLITKYGRCSMFDVIMRKKFDGCFRRKVPFNELAEV